MAEMFNSPDWGLLSVQRFWAASRVQTLEELDLPLQARSAQRGCAHRAFDKSCGDGLLPFPQLR